MYWDEVWVASSNLNEAKKSSSEVIKNAEVGETAFLRRIVQACTGSSSLYSLVNS